MALIYILYSLSFMALIITILGIVIFINLKKINKKGKLIIKAIRLKICITTFISFLLTLLFFSIATALWTTNEQINIVAAIQALFMRNNDCTCYALCTGDPEDDAKCAYELCFGNKEYQKLIAEANLSAEDKSEFDSFTSGKDKGIFLSDRVNDEMVQCYKDIVGNNPNFRSDDRKDRTKMSDSELKKDLKALLKDYKVNGKNPNCGCKNYGKTVLTRKCLGEAHFRDGWSWKEIWESDSSSSSSEPSNGSGNGYVPGNATGQYAVQLDDGSYYWYHQSSVMCGCTYCGDWTQMDWSGSGSSPCKFGKNGCAVYSLAMAVSNLVGEEVTPRVILSDLGATLSPTSCVTSSTYFSGIMIKRDAAVNQVASAHGLKVAPVDKTVDSIDAILNKGGYIWGSWHGSFDWYGGSGHFMVIRKGDDSNYYCFTSCRGPGGGTSGKQGAINTMNIGVPKNTVISFANSGQWYGFWSDKPVSSGGGTNGGTIGNAEVNQNVYNILASDPQYAAKAYAMSAAYAAAAKDFGENFAIGLMANIHAEGNYGQLEYKGSAKYWNGCPQEIAALAGKIISNRQMAETWLTKTPRVSGFGVGSIQWSSPGRRDGILNLYLANASTYSQEELGGIEVMYMIQEFHGGYAGVVSSCSGKSASECASIICRTYEVPSHTDQKAVQRAAVAADLESKLK